jgi:hypothetical protein
MRARPSSSTNGWPRSPRPGRVGPCHPERPAAPFAINQIVHKSNDRLEHDMAVCAQVQGADRDHLAGARVDVNDAVHAWGGIVLHDIINNAFAHKAIEKGADGLIAVAAGAGGHAGVKSPFALVQEIREWFDGPLACCRAPSPPAMPSWPPGAGSRLRLHRFGLHRHREARAPRPTSSASSTAAATTSSTPTCSPACTATTSSRRSATPAWTPTTCPRATPAR